MNAAQTFLSDLALSPQLFLRAEFFVATLVLIYSIFFYIGARKNYHIASRFADALHQVLSSKFSHIGVNPSKTRLLRDGPADYWWHATGNSRVRYLSAHAALQPRMDLFFYISSALRARRTPDVVQIIVATHERPRIPHSICVVKQRELSRLKELNEGEAMKNVQALAGDVSEPVVLGPEFIAMAEHTDVVTAVLCSNKRVHNILKKDIVRNSLLVLHVTDQKAEWTRQVAAAAKTEPTGLVWMEFSLPKRHEEIQAVIAEMAALAMALADGIGSVKLSATAAQKARDLRKEKEEAAERERQKFRMEMAAAERELKKKREEERVYKMSAEKQAKYEEKKRRKEYRDRLRKAAK